MRPPFVNGTPSQGNQSPLLPTTSYRSALAALDSHCKSGFGGNGFAALAPTDQDKVLQSLEKGEIKFDGFDGKVFFELLLQNTMEGFFADPIYGGNRNKAGWRMVGYPGLPATWANKALEYRGKKVTIEPQSIADFS
jgi:gluconate 2-dehydrogenase gamma chain